MTQTTANPLAEATTDSLDIIFGLDPLQLSEQHIERVVTEMRRMRQIWEKDEAAKPQKVAGGAKAPKAPKATMTLDMLNIPDPELG